MIYIWFLDLYRSFFIVEQKSLFLDETYCASEKTDRKFLETDRKRGGGGEEKEDEEEEEEEEEEQGFVLERTAGIIAESTYHAFQRRIIPLRV